MEKSKINNNRRRGEGLLGVLIGATQYNTQFGLFYKGWLLVEMNRAYGSTVKIFFQLVLSHIFRNNLVLMIKLYL